MKLSATDKDILKKWGHSDSDLLQIQDAINVTVYTLDTGNGKKQITANKARNILGDEIFLSGISRSAFHWNCGRESGDGQYISFDSSRLFK